MQLTNAPSIVYYECSKSDFGLKNGIDVRTYFFSLNTKKMSGEFDDLLEQHCLRPFHLINTKLGTDLSHFTILELQNPLYGVPEQ